MKFLIRNLDYTKAGREIVREREVESDRLTIGRATFNDVQLPDLAIEQEHVRLIQTPAGGLRLEAVGKLGFSLDGRSEKSATVDPARGALLELGSTLIELDREDGAIALTIRQAPAAQGARDRLQGFALASVLPGKRIMAWTAMLSILLVFLIVPVWSHLTRERVAPDLDRSGAVMFDASWNPGPLSQVHHGLTDDCESCHVKPFVAVRDEACLTCHTDIGEHATADRMALAIGAPSGGAALMRHVADAFHKPGPGACTDCHTEHEGSGPMQPTAQQFCSDCHGTLDQRLTDLRFGNAADFGQEHPQFTALVMPSPNAARPVRASLDTQPRDVSGLRFPHDLHLDAGGGVTQMARRLGAAKGYGVQLECRNCHTPTADGVRFLPVDMESDCEDCHSLVYDKVGDTFRTLRHGNIAQTQADLLAADRSPRRPVTTGRQRPGQFARGGVYYNNFSRISSGTLRASVMDKDGLCGECHLPGNGRKGGISIAPVTQRTRYMVGGWFDHAAHIQEDCTTCHAADASASADDLLLPRIAICRDCHQGEEAHDAAVPSSCAMCHSYHPRKGAAAAPPRIARRIVGTIE